MPESETSAGSRLLSERVLIIALACAAATIVLLAAYFADNRPSDIDEIGLYNPSYMVSRWAVLTYPAYGYYDKPVIVHPPIHTGVIGLLGRLGFTWYYAEGTPVAVFFLIGILIVATGPFPSVTKAALLLAAIFLINLDDQVLFWFGMRPEGHLHAAWFVSLLLLESARLATWSRWRLFAGAFVLSWASCVHYYAIPAMGGLLVYLVWAMRSLPRKEALGRVQAMIAGALLFVAPFVFLYLIPNWSLIASSIVGHQSSGGTALSMQTHFEMYRYWAGDQLLPALVRWACAARVPLMVWSSAILIAVLATRGIGLAALPLQLGIFFFASHKQNHYLVHELAMLSVAAAVGLGELIALAGRVRMAGVRLRAAVAPALTAICCLYLLKDPVNFHRIYFSIRPHIHEADIARAATREILGDGAQVTGRIGTWYQAGADHWRDPVYDILVDVAPFQDDIRRYLGAFDAVAEYPHRSGDDTYHRRLATISQYYATGLVKLRGFYFSEYASDLDTILMSVNPTAKLTGYLNRWGTLYRFEESPQGEHAVISATCPNLPELPFWSFLAAFPWAARSVLQLPKTPGGPEIIATVVTPLAKEGPTKLLETKCKLIGRVTGTLTKVDLDQLIAKFRRNDRPIHVYRSFEEMPGGYSPAKANAATPTH